MRRSKRQNKTKANPKARRHRTNSIQTMIQELDAFTLGYIRCALWSSNDESDPLGSEYLDECYSIADITPEDLQEMKSDCAAFQEKCKALLAESGLSASTAGNDFWLTRTHHGAGYWDRGLGDVGRKLTDAAKSWGDCDLFVGRDGKIHLT